MAGLEDIIQGIHFQGLGESATELQSLGAAGVHAFDQIKDAAEQTASGLVSFSGGMAAIAIAIAALVVKTAEFTMSQVEAGLQMQALGEAAHMGAAAVKGLQEGFEEAGVNGRVFMRVMERLAITTSNSWQQIQRSVREGDTAERAAAQSIKSSHLRIEEAHNESALASQRSAQTLRSDAISVQEAWLNLQSAASEMSSKISNDFLSVQSASQGVAGAALSVEQAELHLRETRSGKKDEGAEQDLKLKQAEHQVEQARLGQQQARQRLSDASMKESKDVASRELGPEKAKLAFDQAQNKQFSDMIGASTKVAQADLSLEKAILGLKEAMSHAEGARLRNVKNAETALQSGSGVENFSNQTLRQAITDMAGKDFAGGKEPDWIKMLRELSPLFKGGNLSEEKQLGIVGSLGFRGKEGADFVKGLRTKDIDRLIAEGEGKYGGEKGSLGPEGIERLEKAKQVQVKGEAISQEAARQIAEGFERTGEKIIDVLKDIKAALTGRANVGAPGVSEHHAGGGFISGAGTGTSDSIPARLSHGEYVVRSAAVQRYGTDLFDALNTMALGGFALGGHIGPTPVRMGEGGPAAEGMAPLTLVLDGNKFGGLKAPAHVATKLKSYAVSQQYSRAGIDPSWNR